MCQLNQSLPSHPLAQSDVHTTTSLSHSLLSYYNSSWSSIPVMSWGLAGLRRAQEATLHTCIQLNHRRGAESNRTMDQPAIKKCPTQQLHHNILAVTLIGYPLLERSIMVDQSIRWRWREEEWREKSKEEVSLALHYLFLYSLPWLILWLKGPFTPILARPVSFIIWWCTTVFAQWVNWTQGAQAHPFHITPYRSAISTQHTHLFLLPNVNIFLRLWSLL